MLRVFPVSLTRATSCWLRNEPTGSIKTWEDLKTKFLNKYCLPGRNAKKIEEINNFQQEPDETVYQAWERFKELLMKCPQHYLTEMQEVILFYNGLDVPTRQILDSKGVVPTKTAGDAKKAIQEMIKKVNEKVYAAQVGCEHCKGPHYTKDCSLKEEGKPLEESYYTQFSGPFQGGGYRATAPGQTTIPFLSRLNGYYCEEKKGSYGPQFSESYSEASHINNSIPQKEKDLGSFTLPCFINNVCFDNALVDLGTSVSVMPLSTYLNLRLGELAHTKLTVELADRIVKYPKGIAKNVLVGIGKFTFPVDFIYLDMPEDIKVPLILGRPFLSTARAKIDDYIELNDLNEPFKLRRNQGDDLMPTIKEGEVIEKFRTRDDEIYAGIDDYPSYCDYDKKIHIFNNSIMKDKMVYEGNNVIGALMNVPIFVGTFSILTDFAVLENMDDYRDEGMGDVIFGEPFFRDVGINAKRFERMITIYNGNDEVTYQMVRSHPRFKYHTNEQCNKIPPLLKVSEEDKMNVISHPYQKLKGFYKGVLNLGPDYIRDVKMEEWLTRGHISVHEME
ncbi:putative reverse transcriptase domain-containing protein [Tanacetum coccineum]